MNKKTPDAVRQRRRPAGSQTRTSKKRAPRRRRRRPVRSQLSQTRPFE